MVRLNISAELQRLMKVRGWTRYRLSKNSGVHINSVIRAVAGTHDVNLEALLALAAALETTVDRLAAPAREVNNKETQDARAHKESRGKNRDRRQHHPGGKPGERKPHNPRNRSAR